MALAKKTNERSKMPFRTTFIPPPHTHRRATARYVLLANRCAARCRPGISKA